ncbi:hypothetical protein [Acidaminococcus sp.]|uniref:hypothetical protein n=1 Tax=Acidaminococcus sp. TaxID=1872103 RepID=UPI003D7EAAEE
MDKWNRIKLKLAKARLQLLRFTMDKWYNDGTEKNPENWRTINGSHVLVQNGKIVSGAGGKFRGNTWTGRHNRNPLAGAHRYIGPRSAPEDVPLSSQWRNVPTKEQRHRIAKTANALTGLRKSCEVPEWRQKEINQKITEAFQGKISNRALMAYHKSLLKDLKPKQPATPPQNIATKATIPPDGSGTMNQQTGKPKIFDFPAAFSARGENTNTKRVIAYIQGLAQADSTASTIYANLGKLQRGTKALRVIHKKGGYFCPHGIGPTPMEINYPRAAKDSDPDSLKARKMQTFFHENMHMADWCAGRGKGFYSAHHSGLENAINNAKTNYYPGNEVQNFLKDCSTRTTKLASDARKRAYKETLDEINEVREKYRSGEIDWYKFTSKAKTIKHKQAALVRKYTEGGLEGEDGRWGALCDIYDALSDGKVYTNDTLKLGTRCGHGVSYYKGDPENAALEMTANWGVLRMQAPKLAAMFAKDKPEVAKQLDQVLKEIAEVSKNGK